MAQQDLRPQSAGRATQKQKSSSIKPTGGDMAKKATKTTSKRRTQANKLSKSGKSLSTADAKKVKGGTGAGAGKVSMNDFHFGTSSRGTGAGGGKVSMND